ncbi:hypothetical protein V7150_07855 [Neobacillus drentensis]|uniref:hypothetical protein n=1 Tax=Neobacillus drentensis TaxID=220684 RepID=UPI00300077D7
MMTRFLLNFLSPNNVTPENNRTFLSVGKIGFINVEICLAYVFRVSLVGPLKRERIVEVEGRKARITTIVLRPASTIGVRDKSSFFARLYVTHATDQYPMIGNGAAKVSLVDTRDIGRAMAWLGTYQEPENDHSIFLLKGFDTTWNQLKTAIDNATGKISKTMHLPKNLTEEQMIAYKLTPFAVKTFTVNRIWDDNKIRKLGFNTKYSLTDAVEAEIRDLIRRNHSI